MKPEKILGLLTVGGTEVTDSEENEDYEESDDYEEEDGVETDESCEEYEESEESADFKDLENAENSEGHTQFIQEYSGRTGDSVDHDTQTLRYYDIHYARGSFTLQSGLEINDTLVSSKQRTWSCAVFVDKKALLLLSDGRVQTIEHNKTVELGGEEGKWEGDVCDGKPCGWGIQYDKDGNMVYEGFRGVTALATTLRTTKLRMLGIGTWESGGDGVFSDWIDDNPLKKRVEVADGEESSITYHSGIEELIIHEEAFCDRHMKKLNLSIFSSLRVLEIDEGCFCNVETTHIEGLDHLETVRIGRYCFGLEDDWGEGKGERLSSAEGVRGGEQIVPELLETISIGSVEEKAANCFWYSSLVLRNMPKLRTVTLGGACFCGCHKAVFENLPMLESIQLGKDALKFVDLKGTVLMLSNLPKLTTLTTRGDSESFWGPHIVTFEGASIEMVLQTDLPALTTATIFSSFHGAHKWRVFNAGVLESHYGVCRHDIHSNIGNLSELRSLGKTLTELVFDAGCESYTKLEKLDFSEYTKVTRIVIGNHSFKRVEEVIVEGLPLLVELEFGEGCFSYEKESDDETGLRNLLSDRRAGLGLYGNHDGYGNYNEDDDDFDDTSDDTSDESAGENSEENYEENYDENYDENYEENYDENYEENYDESSEDSSQESDEYPRDPYYDTMPNGTLRVAACPALKHVTISGWCCFNYSRFTLEKLPALETLTIGSREPTHFCGSFFHTHLSMHELPALRSVVIGTGCFRASNEAVISDLPALESLFVGACAFEGERRWYDSNEAFIGDMPKLTTLEFGNSENGSSTFEYYYEVVLTRMPSLKKVSIPSCVIDRVNWDYSEDVGALNKYFHE
ncbi:hypothetical protein BLSTO_00480 [Blastocystis sp. subtype 1]